jgi:hypothetical protein
MMAAAAKHHSIPVVVCTGLYKLSPLYPNDEDSFNVAFNPDSVLGFEEGDLIEKVTVTNPYYDYVSPELVILPHTCTALCKSSCCFLVWAGFTPLVYCFGGGRFLTRFCYYFPPLLPLSSVENYDPSDRTFDL